jgi:hypothetical protein
LTIRKSKFFASFHNRNMQPAMLQLCKVSEIEPLIIWFRKPRGAQLVMPRLCRPVSKKPLGAYEIVI